MYVFFSDFKYFFRTSPLAEQFHYKLRKNKNFKKEKKNLKTDC